MTSVEPHQGNRDEFRRVVAMWLDDCIRRDGSIFTPDRAVWTVGALRDLKGRFVDSPDYGSNTFEEKFQRQLEGALDEVVQLSAELLYVHFLPAIDLTIASKRRLIDLVLGWMRAPATVPPRLAEVLGAGVLTAGQGYRQHRPHQLWFLIEASLALKELGEPQREEVLADPWATKELLLSLPIRSAFLTRNILLNLLHPEVFEDIASRRHKTAIVEHYRALTTEEDEDRALVEIRARLEQSTDGAFEFYSPEVRKQWDPIKRPTRAWLLRGANVQSHNLVDRWVAEGFCSIGWLEIGDVLPGSSRANIAARLREVDPDASEALVRNGTSQLYRFVNEIAEGDTIVTVDGQDVRVGRVTSPVEWIPFDPDDTDPDTAEVVLCPRRLGVIWSEVVLHRADLSQAFNSKLKTLITLSEVSRLLPEIDDRLALAPADAPRTEQSRPGGLRPPSSALADRLHLRLAWLEDLVDSLREKRQVVLYGPPGTGKTYLATQLAEDLVDDPANTQLIQFHPSYAYEDFFEGFRPQPTEDGQVRFELVPGPLKRLATLADEHPDRTYILVIDEINRANLAKVFGELYFALEYRDVAIRLQYSPDQPFTLPDNLYFIGTMNSSDRSIALVDAAMRRRFYFYLLSPNQDPVRDLLRRSLRPGQSDLAARLLDEVNSRIDDPDAAIGPSYFMTDSAGTEAGLRKIWERAIIPLLEEHYLGTGRNVAEEFGFDVLVKHVRGVP